MIKLTVTVSANDKTPIEELAKRELGAKKITDCVIIKKSVDARKKNDVRVLYQVAVETENDKMYIRSGVEAYENEVCTLENMLAGKKTDIRRPIVVGSGPAGLFCALTLATLGAKPLVIERGEKIEKRTETVKKFFDTLDLDFESNVQFGEGGAGTFSDGKLNTNLHNEYVKLVINEFVKSGAPEETAYLAKPHIGTDKLAETVKNIRERIINLGGEFLFSTKVTDIVSDGGAVSGVMTDKGIFESRDVFLCPGHSARDTFEMLYAKGVSMVSKIFSMGVRIEHSRADIDKSQYGIFAGALPAADYKLSCRTDSGKSLYTFCMCPGGKVINCSSERGGVCVNGMSLFARDGENSDSALLVNVGEEDWKSGHPLAGMEFQRRYERLVYEKSGGYRPLVQLLGDFENNAVSKEIGDIIPSVETGYSFGNLRECLPRGIAETIVCGVKDFGRKIRGFDRPDAVLCGIESRSSSPVKILRDENYRSSIAGLYPAGEGSGYSGGIVSSAVDGIKAALTVCGCMPS